MSSTKGINYLILIQKQRLQVLQNGGSASELAQLIYDYELQIQKQINFGLPLFSDYCASLFLSHEFIQIKCVIQRFSTLYQGIKDNKEVLLYKEILGVLRKNDYTKFLQKTVQLESVALSQLKNLFVQSAKSFIIKSLSKNYINIETGYLSKTYSIQQKDLLQNNCKIDGKFAVLPLQKKIDRIDQLMRDRIRQVSTITENVAKGGESH